MATKTAPEIKNVEGRCVVCQHPLADHFSADNAWVGCGRLPRRRTPVFVPFIVLTPDVLNALQGQQSAAQEPAAPVAEQPAQPTPTRRGRTTATGRTVTPPAATFKEAVARRAAAPKEVRATTNASAKEAAAEMATRRGRTAGRYLPTGKTPTWASETVAKVAKVITSHKKGMFAKEVAERLQMPMGTVGWAIRHLMQQGVLTHTAA